MVSVEWKNAEVFEQMAARGSAGRDLGQWDETLIQEIYKNLPLFPWGSRDKWIAHSEASYGTVQGNDREPRLQVPVDPVP